MLKFRAFINGEFTSSVDELEIISPIDNSIAGSVHALKEKDINLAFEAARKSFDLWKNTKHEDKIALIKEFSLKLNNSKEKLAKIINMETGKKIKDALTEVERSVDYINETIVEWEKIRYESIVVGSKKANLHKIPLGVVLAISPFNYPVNLSVSKIIPALLIGNTVVFKPATNGSLTGAFMTELFSEINFPNGVFNLVTGRGRDIGDILVKNKEIDMITFTGGAQVGKRISQNKSMIPLVLELGGNDAAYIKEDADLENALKEVVKGSFSFAGQRCTAIKRLILHKQISKLFIQKLVEEVSKQELEPIITKSSARYIEELINDSKTRGDEFVLEGTIDGNYIKPHIVITDKFSRVWNEEPFGPILPIVITDGSNIVELFNDTEFGLQNSIFTKDIEWAKQIALKIESGTVNINKSSSRGPDIFPFSGIKNSGFGTQGIKDALISMSRVLNIVEND